MKSFQLALIALLLSCSACSGNDREVNEMRSEIKNLQGRVGKLEQGSNEKAQVADRKKTAFNSCVFSADLAYSDFINRNKTAKRKDGSIAVPNYIVVEARQQKHEAIEECKVIYGDQQ